MDFLKEVLFYPNIKNQQFDQLTFDLEKNNLRLYLESLKEDKQTFASYALQELYLKTARTKNSKFRRSGRNRQDHCSFASGLLSRNDGERSN